MNKVVWAEGLFLSQQHFQAWDSQRERAQHMLQSLLNPFCWGVISLAIDQEALSLGRFQLLEARILFQDGRLAAYHSSMDEPLSCELKAPAGEPLAIYLAVPSNQHVAGISGYPQRNQASGWLANYRDLEDSFDASRKREILLAKPNLHLLSGEQATLPFLRLKIAEVIHDGDHHYRLTEGFIPPVCRIAASPVLLQRLGRIIDTLNAKRKQIEQTRAGCDGGSAQFAKADPGSDNLLRNLNMAIPQLRHLHQNPDLHPEQLYRVLCQSLGAFCTHHSELTIDFIPPYNQEELAQIFQRLEGMLTSLLEIKSTSKPSSLDLERESSSLLCCYEIPEAVFSQHTFFLEALYESDDPNWISDFARQVKVTPRSVMETVVATALPGVRLIHTQRPPAKLSTRSGYEYFRLEARGDFWAQIKTEGTLAIYLPHLFSTTDVKLVTVEE